MPEPFGATVVLGLGDYVGYREHLGWKDLFSSAAFSNRHTEDQSHEVSIIGFLQERHRRRIVGAGSTRVNTPQASQPTT